ncbi:Nonsense-mediated mRNA decay protein 5 [Tieghemiomyces parasiticus]|uniref:Nonsense-mediated mRNA decay protein 5 n=1 Tax=Tieghemiomyces parasiticus TaxID=78921 RepID=A0A9W8E1T2_9FUNG|nr:Nonsense-mediated mRNA decay protein 5 [Tieghemiomyces parasiticus]
MASPQSPRPWDALCQGEGLEMMPSRVLRRICHYLTPDPADLLSLARTARSFETYALEYLWRRPAISSPTGFGRFLTAVTRARHRAPCVRTLNLTVPRAHPLVVSTDDSFIELDAGDLFAPVGRSRQAVHRQVRDSMLADPNMILALVRACENLRALTIYGHCLDDRNLLALASLCPQLRRLAIIGGPRLGSPALARAVCQLPHLRALDLDLDVPLAGHLAALAAISGALLDRLVVTAPDLVGDQVTTLLAQHPALRTLAVAPVASLNSDHLASWTHTHSHLRSLTLTGGTVDIIALSAIMEHCPQLRHLDLRREASAGPDPAEVDWMMPACANLEALVVDNVAVTDNVLLTLANACPRVRVLGLRDSAAVTDEGVGHVAENVVRLETLSIVRCSGVTDASLTFLRRHQASHLRHVIIEACALQSAAAVEQFTADCFNLRLTLIKGTEIVRQPFAYVRNFPLPAPPSEDPDALARLFAPAYPSDHPLSSTAAQRMADEVNRLTTLLAASQGPAARHAESQIAQRWRQYFGPTAARPTRERATSEKRPRPSPAVAVGSVSHPPSRPYPVPTHHRPRPESQNFLIEHDQDLPRSKHRKSVNQPSLPQKTAILLPPPLPVVAKPGQPYSFRPFIPMVERPPISRVPSNLSTTSSVALSEKRPIAPAPPVLIRWEEWGSVDAPTTSLPPPLARTASTASRGTLTSPALHPTGTAASQDSISALISNLARAQQGAKQVATASPVPTDGDADPLEPTSATTSVPPAVVVAVTAPASNPTLVPDTALSHPSPVPVTMSIQQSNETGVSPAAMAAPLPPTDKTMTSPDLSNGTLKRTTAPTQDLPTTKAEPPKKVVDHPTAANTPDKIVYPPFQADLNGHAVPTIASANGTSTLKPSGSIAAAADVVKPDPVLIVLDSPEPSPKKKKRERKRKAAKVPTDAESTASRPQTPVTGKAATTATTQSPAAATPPKSARRPDSALGSGVTSPVAAGAKRTAPTAGAVKTKSEASLTRSSKPASEPTKPSAVSVGPGLTEPMARPEIPSSIPTETPLPTAKEHSRSKAPELAAVGTTEAVSDSTTNVLTSDVPLSSKVLKGVAPTVNSAAHPSVSNPTSPTEPPTNQENGAPPIQPATGPSIAAPAALRPTLANTTPAETKVPRPQADAQLGLGEATKTARRRSGRSKLLLKMNVETQPGNHEVLSVYEGDAPHQVARAFCQTHNMLRLETSLVAYIERGIAKRQRRKSGHTGETTAVESGGDIAANGPSAASPSPAATVS